MQLMSLHLLKKVTGIVSLSVGVGGAAWYIYDLLSAPAVGSVRLAAAAISVVGVAGGLYLLVGKKIATLGTIAAGVIGVIAALAALPGSASNSRTDSTPSAQSPAPRAI